MRQRRWIELLSNYECKIKYHPGKANVVADALSRKERLKPRRVRAMSMTIQSTVLKAKILEAQSEASKDISPSRKAKRIEKNIFEEAGYVEYTSSIRDMVPVVLVIGGLELHLQSQKYPKWKWENITMDLVTKLPKSSNRDGRFASHLWQALQKALGTKLNMSTTYHPETDSQSERTIQTLEDMLRLIMDFGGSWDDSPRRG
ncbi:putative reverse transcriptase domain-containing protein [Tanacetum coccineum]